MPTRKSQHTLTTDEIDWLFYHRYAITTRWIGPTEGYEYRVRHAGEHETIAYRRSLRAAFNAAQKIEKSKQAGTGE